MSPSPFSETILTARSGSGKTQILLHLLLSVQLPWPYGLSKRALYISTETDLPTVRLVQLLNIHPSIASLADDIPRPSLDNILSTTTLDLETQDHIIKFQVPIAVERYDVGLLVIDSIATNYRAEMSSDSPSVLLDRAWQLKQLGALLRALAAQRNIAIVISNQVADRFNDTNDFDDTAWAIEPAGTNPACSPSPQHFFSSSLGHPTSSSQVDMSDIQQCQSQSLSSPWKNDAQTGHGHLKIPSLSTILSLDYERSFVSGLGGHRAPTLEASWSEPAIAWKVPSLGVVWTNQISCRIMLRMEQTTKWSTQQENKQYPKPAVHACQTTRSAESQRAHEHEHKESIGNHLYDECCPSRLLFREAEEDTVPSMLSDQPLLYEAYTTSMSAPDNLIINQQRRRRTVHIVFCPWATGNPNQGHKPLDPLTNHGEQGTVGSNSDDGDAAFNREFDSMSFPIEIVIAGDGVHTVK